jgi:sugar phosphate isomerase/epimerase
LSRRSTKRHQQAYPQSRSALEAGQGASIVQYNPLSPDPQEAAQADQVIRDAILLARLLGVPVINGFSGLPAGSPNDSMPNWVTCPWPPFFLEILKYQWDEKAIPYWREMAKVLDDNGIKLAFEMHPGMLVYNVDTLLRLRDACGDALGCNFDPSHLWWNGVDVVAAIRQLGSAIFHMHGKDVAVDTINTHLNGCNDHKPYSQIAQRSWTFRSIGYGHDLKTWRDLISALRIVGYDYVISIEHEDALMSPDEGLAKSINTLRDAVMFEAPGEMFWA